ncbi:MAG: hypothetical protein KKA42_06705 [candidate division Zixibacteria bacterium]|nr:hypothetical protein [candidate division Zixibacteria bacterium]
MADKSTRIPLGAAGPSIGPALYGEVIDYTYEDAQYQQPGRRVAYRGMNSSQAYVHFSYDELNTDANDVSRQFGYNIYDPLVGQWPHLSGGGCEFPSEQHLFARYGNIDIYGDGRAVIGGYQGERGVAGDNRVADQLTIESCTFFGNGVPVATYLPLALDSADALSVLPSTVIEIQEYGGQTYVHFLAVDYPATLMGDGWAKNALIYFQRVGTSSATAWTNGQVLDTVRFPNTAMAASRISGKVAVVYNKENQYALDNDYTLDKDMYYRESDSVGFNWGPRTCITNYTRDVPSHTAIGLFSAVYLDDDLNVAFTAYPLPANPVYASFTAGGDFSDLNYNLFHWSKETGLVSEVAWGNYGHAANTKVCGWDEDHYLSSPTISECNGNLFIVWKQVHRDIITLGGPGATEATAVYAIDSLGAANDCWSNIDATRAIDGFIGFGANAELYMSVMINKADGLWDDARNLTQTYTPACSTAGFGGICGNEQTPSVARHGYDESGLSLTWPPDATLDMTPDGDPPYAGTHYLHMQYLDDEMPGIWWNRPDDTVPSSALYIANYNAMRWIRLACVDPVTNPLIAVTPGLIQYPTWVPNGEQLVVETWVKNPGTEALLVSEIGIVENPGASVSGWLNTSAGALASIPYRDSAAFNIILNDAGIIDNPGSSEIVTGHIYLLSDAFNNDSVVVPIEILIADTLVGMAWDTVTTTEPWGGAKAYPFTGEHVGLAVNNIGSFGGNGLGGVNMDFTVAGGDCDANADVYLYDGSLFALRNTGSDVFMSTSLHNQNFAGDLAFKPIDGAAMVGGAGTAYDSAYTGMFANWDTTLVFERTYYAPRNNDDAPSFVIAKTKVYSPTGAAVDHLTLGSVVDWDVPADDGSDNTTGVLIPTATLYCEGTDTLKDPDEDCQDNVNRFAAEAFFGWYTDTEIGGNECANNPAYYGVWADSFHGWWDDAIDSGFYDRVWDSCAANVSLNGNTGNYDQAVFTTYVHDYTLAADAELTFYTCYVTLQNGELQDFQAAIQMARAWYFNNLRAGSCATNTGACCVASECFVLPADVCASVGGSYNGDGTTCDPNPCLTCCIGTRGSTQLQGGCNDAEQGVDVGDLTNMIDHLFINFTPLCCIDESDISPAITGGVPDGSVDVGDLTAMIDHLFINFPVLPTCQ